MHGQCTPSGPSMFSWLRGAHSKVPGWGSAGEGVALVTRTHAFFRR